MAALSAHSPPLAPVPAPLPEPHAGESRYRRCPHCGGSGSLRLADQRFRTCLECLGRGRLLAIGETLPVACLRTASPVSSSAAR